jgi:hypothetical protein
MQLILTCSQRRIHSLIDKQLGHRALENWTIIEEDETMSRGIQVREESMSQC